MIPSRVPRVFAALSLISVLCGFSFPGLGGRAEKKEKGPPGARLVVFLIVGGLSEKTFADNAYAYGDGGFLFLMQNGAWFEDAHHGHAATLAAPGQASVMTGNDPVRHGIAGDSSTGRKTGALAAAAGPKPGAAGLAVPTLGDALAEATGGRSRVFAVGGDEAAAVVCAGKRGVAYSFDAAASRFARRPAGRVKWNDRAERRGPSADALVLDFAEELVAAEKLGTNATPDVLVLALPSLDALQHRHGPDGEAVRRHLVALDARLAGFLGFLDAEIGLERTFVVLTADHGFGAGAPLPAGALTSALGGHLTKKFGKHGLVLASQAPWIYLNAAAMKAEKLDAAAVEAEAEKFLEGHPGVAEAFTRAEAFEGMEPLAKAVRRSWAPQAGDLYVVPEEGRFFAESASAKGGHGTPYAADTNVPVVFFGEPFTEGLYGEPIETVDIVPTLAEALGLKMPPVEGTPLTETFERAARS